MLHVAAGGLELLGEGDDVVDGIPDGRRVGGDEAVDAGDGVGGLGRNLAQIAQAGGEVGEGLLVEQLAVDALHNVGDLRGDGFEFIHEVGRRAGRADEVERFLAGDLGAVLERWQLVRAWDNADVLVAEEAGGLDEELGIGADLVLGVDLRVECDDAGVGVEMDRADLADRHASHHDDGVALEAVDVSGGEMQ